MLKVINQIKKILFAPFDAYYLFRCHCLELHQHQLHRIGSYKCTCCGTRIENFQDEELAT